MSEYLEYSIDNSLLLHYNKKCQQGQPPKDKKNFLKKEVFKMARRRKINEITYECFEMGEKQDRIIEHYSLKSMKQLLKDYISENEYVSEDDSICIKYKDGTFLYVEKTKDIKFTNIEGVIFDNPETTAYAGEGIEIVDYNQLYEDWGGEDWRVEFIA